MLENEVRTDTSVRVWASESFAMQAFCPEKPYDRNCGYRKGVRKTKDESEKSTAIIRKYSRERNEVRDEVMRANRRQPELRSWSIWRKICLTLIAPKVFVQIIATQSEQIM